MALRHFLVCATFGLVAVSSAHGAASQALTEEQMRGVCAAQEYLRRNGYLNEPAAQDRSKINLGLWDKLTYTENGNMNWDKLSEDRRGRFVGKLYAYLADGIDHLIVYRVMPNDTCLRVSKSLDAVHKLEGNCRPDLSKAQRIAEDDLRCPSEVAPTN